MTEMQKVENKRSTTGRVFWFVMVLSTRRPQVFQNPQNIHLLPNFSVSGPSFCREIRLRCSSLGFVAYNLASGHFRK